MNKNSRILIVGHNDIIEKSLTSYFQGNGFPFVFSSSTIGLNVLDPASVRQFFKDKNPEYVFLGSIRSGGIDANQKHGGEFLYENLVGQNNVIRAAYLGEVKKLLYFASSCVYPKRSRQPIKEDYLLTGQLEETSQPYAVSKIAGLELCRAYRRQYGFNAIVMVPATVYGPEDEEDLNTAHVMGALIGRFHQAALKKQKEVVVWGSGRPRREFLFSDDLVQASVFLMDGYEGEGIINAGAGSDLPIRKLAKIIARVVGFKGRIIFDRTKPDGAKRKLLDSSRISQLGWQARVSLEEGIDKTYQWYKKDFNEQRS
jgi:GDP-L-fucose synthase